jgi:peptidoglycan biosynthesis protein MviN/MurJ (putative lipid II flippase)
MSTIASSLLPIASKFKNNPIKYNTFLSVFMVLVTCILAVLTLFMMFFTEPLMQSFTSPEIWEQVLKSQNKEAYIWTTRVLCLSVLTFAIQAIFGVILTIKKNFIAYSSVALIFNISTILGIYFADGNFFKVAVATTTGFILGNIFFIWQGLKTGYTWCIDWDTVVEIQDDINAVFLNMLPRIFILDGLFVATLVLTLIQTQTGQGTAFDNSTSIQNAFFIIISSFATVLFPNLTEILHRDKEESKESGKSAFMPYFYKYLKIAAVAGLIVSLVAYFGVYGAVWLFELMGKGQNLGPNMIQLVQVSTIFIFFRALKEVMSRYFYAKEKTWQLLILSTFSLGCQLLGIAILQNFGVKSDINVSISLVVSYLAWDLMAYYMIVKAEQ